jgi:caffeoyl-CoA O-methyltransferase
MTTEVRFWDKLLPNQTAHSHLYTGDRLMRDLFELASRSSGIQDPHDEFELVQTDLFTIEEMASNPVALRFYQFLIRVSGARRVLEIGTFVGLSTMCFAKALPVDGEVVTIEKFDLFAGLAQRNFELNGFDHKITLLQGDALDVLDGLPRDQLFDLVFVDGNKERYKDYAVETEPLLSANGIMIVDDCFYHGDALNAAPTDPKGEGVRAFMEYVAAREDWLRSALPIFNGVFMMVRGQRSV